MIHSMRFKCFLVPPPQSHFPKVRSSIAGVCKGPSSPPRLPGPGFQLEDIQFIRADPQHSGLRLVHVGARRLVHQFFTLDTVPTSFPPAADPDETAAGAGRRRAGGMPRL